MVQSKFVCRFFTKNFKIWSSKKNSGGFDWTYWFLSDHLWGVLLLKSSHMRPNHLFIVPDFIVICLFNVAFLHTKKRGFSDCVVIMFF